MTRIIFIGATGTDIGKTYITVMLLRQLRDQGYRVRAIKPVISGFEVPTMADSDSGLLLQAMEMAATPENITAISPWRYRHALPPHLAAQQENKPIIIDQVVEFCRKNTGQDVDFLLIEGVGGIMTPLNYKYTTLDIMTRLDCHCLMVCATTLGTLSHTISAVSCLEQRGVILDGLVICESQHNYTDFTTIIDDFKKLMPDIIHKPVGRNRSSTEIFTLVT